ncbi:nucleoside deaminase [Pseudogracilibacillus auburnensis]|uniref:nucleoside deaminase n=1 Tax=Pseudogracilibacillus auburnensis TaxID=1494959 RepID=UPI001A95BC9D|nr:nucleoside deaminase [Pseudogracilibacillus auburnensis]MBO1003945.1 nucleoside deaminase [Pseudogracilibacillus auburnensis]
MDQFMKRAVELALNNVEEGGGPFGAVLVKDDKIISEGVNELHLKYDISGHAELIAVRKAQEQLQTIDLKGYTMYASGEPCPMCLTAIYFSGIERVYYCGSVEEAKSVGLGTSSFIYQELTKPKQDRTIEMIHMPLEKGSIDPFVKWQGK